MRLLAFICAAITLACQAGAAERWRIQFFHDDDQSSLVIVDLAFASPAAGIAVGYYLEGFGQRAKTGRATALVTRDGGKTWTPERLPKRPRSMFLLNEQACWVVTDDGVLFSSDFGKSWRNLGGPDEAYRAHFLDEKRGWIVGVKKSVYETSDGGRKWTPTPAAAEPKTDPESTVYTSVAFIDGRRGMIAGWSQRTRRPATRVPAWMDPGSARREWPAMAVMLETVDGGENWKTSEASMFGRITRMRVLPDGRGLGLIEFMDNFEWPSEVIRIDLRSGKSERAFRRKDRSVTDIAIIPNGPAFLAAIEPAGQMSHTPVPGKLRMLRSADLQEWSDMTVDYRASARRATLAAAGPGDVWVATDTGMILKLISE